MFCPYNKFIKSDTKSFSYTGARYIFSPEGGCSEGLDAFSQNGSSSSLLTPFRHHPRSTRIFVAYPWPAFSATKRTITLQSVLINKPKFFSRPFVRQTYGKSCTTTCSMYWHITRRFFVLGASSTRINIYFEVVPFVYAITNKNMGSVVL